MSDNYIIGSKFEMRALDIIISRGNTFAYLWNKIPMIIFIKSKIYYCYEDKLKFRRAFPTNWWEI
jgi:hypothetical protein